MFSTMSIMLFDICNNIVLSMPAYSSLNTLLATNCTYDLISLFTVPSPVSYTMPRSTTSRLVTVSLPVTTRSSSYTLLTMNLFISPSCTLSKSILISLITVASSLEKLCNFSISIPAYCLSKMLLVTNST